MYHFHKSNLSNTQTYSMTIQIIAKQLFHAKRPHRLMTPNATHRRYQRTIQGDHEVNIMIASMSQAHRSHPH